MKITYIFGIFGIICLIISSLLSTGKSQPKKLNVYNQSGVVGPLIVSKKNTIYEISIHNPVALNESDYVTVNVLDDKQQYLYSFSGETWNEKGHNADGAWSDQQSHDTLKATFKQPGRYFFEIKPKNSQKANAISITVTEEIGSKVPFFILAIMSFICVFFAYIYGFGANSIGKTVWPIIGILLIICTVTLILSYRGYGYMGYHGYGRGASVFYWDRPDIHYNRSNRDGSIGSRSHRGGGLSGGK